MRRSPLLVLPFFAAILLSSPFRAEGGPPPPGLKIAFIGDQGLGPNSAAVLRLIRREGADAVLHQGDFDYAGDPTAWDAQISRILGANFPYFASVGNHDAARFYGPGGYQELLAARLRRLGISWTGDLGVQASFSYNGIFIVQTAPGILGSGHDLFIRSRLAADRSIWRISSFHKNMRRMQIGSKTDETGWGVYEESRKGGAMVATAHEHSYSRTYLLSSFEHQTVASFDNTLVLSADDPDTPSDEGRSFGFVSGLGGKSVRPQRTGGAWWAGVSTSTQGAAFGALFGVFRYRGDPHLAYFYFKGIDGKIRDEFFVRGPAARIDGPDETH